MIMNISPTVSYIINGFAAIGVFACLFVGWILLLMFKDWARNAFFRYSKLYRQFCTFCTLYDCFMEYLKVKGHKDYYDES